MENYTDYKFYAFLSFFILLSACGGGNSNNTPINNAPLAVSQSTTINEDSPVVFQLGSDVDGDSLTNSIIVAPANGVLSGVDEYVTYTPNANYYGSDSFSFTLSDGLEDSATETVTITITSVNDAPIANDAGISSSTVGVGVAGTLTSSDVDSVTMTYQLLTQPTKGTVTLDDVTTGAFTYIPTSLGTDSFSFNVNDGAAVDSRDSNVATITVTPPAAVAVPGSPALVATAGDQRVALSWAAVDYAESYNVYWSTTTGVTTGVTPDAVTNKPYYYHDGVINNTPYYYIVTAVNGFGEGADSSELSATPLDIAVAGLSFSDVNLASCVTGASAVYVHDLIALDCNSSGISDLGGIEQLTSLTNLTLWGNGFTSVAPLAPLTNLTTLSLYNNSISGGISPLTDMVNLSLLALGNTGITDIIPLANMSSLTTLYLNQNNISDLEPLVGLTGLTTLALYTNSISDLAPLTALTNLTELDLHSNTISDVSSLSALSALTILYLQDNNIFNIDDLSGLVSLNRLSLFDNNIYDPAPLAGLVSLNRLFLGHNQIMDVSSLASLVNLDILYLPDNNIGGEGIGNVDALVTLTAATEINLTTNVTMSCSELTALVNDLPDGNVVSPNVPDPGVNCTSP